LGQVVKQSVSPGQPLTKGETVTLTLDCDILKQHRKAIQMRPRPKNMTDTVQHKDKTTTIKKTRL
jgi:hypothetical protein